MKTWIPPKGTRYPYSIEPTSGPPAFVIDVDLAATTLGHPADRVSLDPFEAALQELKSTVRWPHGAPTVVELSRQMSSCKDLVVEPSQLGSLKGLIRTKD